MTNYLAAIPGAFFGVWLLVQNVQRGARNADQNPTIRHSPFAIGDLHWRAAVRYGFGVLPCLAVLLAYNIAAFGSPFALNTSFQNPAFKEIAPAFLGMFSAPSWFAALVITVSPWRGLFVLSPVLVVAALVLVRRWKMEALVAERRLILGCAAFFFLINICFNGFHGGFAAGPRYLIPALPFLCLPLAAAFVSWPRATTVLAAVSIAQQSLLTITDALNPLGVGSHAWVNHPGEWKDKLKGNSLVWRYAWPFFHDGRPWAVIHAKFEEWYEGQERKAEKAIPDAEERRVHLARVRSETWEKVLRGDQEPLWIAAMSGPVSVNTLGPWDGTFFQSFPAHSEAARWSAFNVGELLWPESRWSLAPLLAMWVAGSVLLRRSVRFA